MNLRHKKFLFSAAAWAALGLSGAQGQTADTSGNGLLKGNFQFRNVAVTGIDSNNNPVEVTATYGAIVFDGAGNYKITGTQVDNTISNGAPQPYDAAGTYAIGSNGTGYVTSPLNPSSQDGSFFEYGAVSQGVFTGSATEGGSETSLNDIFIAIPTGGAPTNSGFTSVYQTGLLDFTGGGSSAILNALFNLSPNGNGGLGAITLNGQASNQLSPTLSQTITGATYSFNSNGSATLTVPVASGQTASTSLFTGTKTIFESADGNFILGWTSGGYDIFFGVKALAAGAGSLSITQGLYFTAALEDSADGTGTDSYYGSEYNTADANGDAIVHQRLNGPGIYGPDSEDYGTDDSFTVNSDGTAADYYYNYIFGDGGQAYVAIGAQGYYSLVVGLHAATFSGTGVYINPVLVFNAASYQPITASLAPGELITLFGTGLSSTTTAVVGGNPVPTTNLGGVSATIDSIPCPVFSVSPTQVSIIVPYGIINSGSIYANIQLTSNGVKSNTVQMYFQDSAPGLFSTTQNGLGFAAIRDALTGAQITQANPATGGEYISLYLTGLGTVTPQIADGAVPSSTVVSTSDEWTNGNLQVLFNDYNIESFENQGTIQFAGLVPGLAALYQINVQIPTGVLGTGDDVEIELFTDSADINQIYIPYGPGTQPVLDRPAGRTPQSRAARMLTIRSRRHAQEVKRRTGRGSATVEPSKQ